MTTRTGTWAIALALVGLASPSVAQTSAEKKAAAEALFDEGRRLLEAGQLESACDKLEQSDRLDPAAGTQLNLAVCYEKAGRTASAWATYRRAAASARARGQTEREQFASAAADRLAPGLSRLRIDVAEPVEGLVVSRNGAAIDAALWGQPAPVDPGTFTIEASAPGRAPWRTTIDVRQPGTTETVSIPALAAAGSEPGAAPPPPVSVVAAAPAPPPDAPPDGSAQRTWGIVVGAAGVVGLGIGGFFALRAISKNDDSKALCLPSDPNQCTPEGAALRDDARSAGNVATVAGGLGLALVATGAVLYLTAPSASVSVGLAPGAVTVGGRFQ